jgi:hypothetical protein
MARPTKYTDEIQEKADRYVYEHDKFDDPVPSMEGLAFALGIHRSTLYDWANSGEKPEFSDTLERIQLQQARLLISKGLKNEFNTTIVKLMMANHGYSERIQNDMIIHDDKVEMPDVIHLVSTPLPEIEDASYS